MLELQFIGNIGHAAELKSSNGKVFVAFSVAVSERRGQESKTTWISCTMNGDGGGLLQYLQKGTQVFIRGNMAISQYASGGNIGVDIKCYVDKIQLVGGKGNAEQSF